MRIHFIWMIFILCTLRIAQNWYEEEQQNKGQSLSNYLSSYHGIDVPPSEARWMQIELTQYEVNISGMDVFTTHTTELLSCP